MRRVPWGAGAGRPAEGARGPSVGQGWSCLGAHGTRSAGVGAPGASLCPARAASQDRGVSPFPGPTPHPSAPPWGAHGAVQGQHTLRLGRLGSFPWEGGPATYPTSCVHSRFQRRLALVAELRASPRPGRLPAVRPSRGHGPCCGHPFIRLPWSSCRAGARLPSHPWLASWGQCLAGGCGVNGGRWGHREGGLPSHRLPHCFCSLVILLFV